MYNKTIDEMNYVNEQILSQKIELKFELINMYSYESDEEEGHVVYANPDSFFASNGKAEKGPEHVDAQKFSSFSASLARFKALGNQVYK
jgi:hypothetical protein